MLVGVFTDEAAGAVARPLGRPAAWRVCGGHRQPVLPAEHRHYRHCEHHPERRKGAGPAQLWHGLHPNGRHHQREWRPPDGRTCKDLPWGNQWLTFDLWDTTRRWTFSDFLVVFLQYGNSGGPLVNLVSEKSFFRLCAVADPCRLCRSDCSGPQPPGARSHTGPWVI